MKPNNMHLRAAAIKAAIVLVPSYTAAYLTEKMVWVVPTLAAASFFAGTIQIAGERIQRRVDEDIEETEETDYQEHDYQESIVESGADGDTN